MIWMLLLLLSILMMRLLMLMPDILMLIMLMILLMIQLLMLPLALLLRRAKVQMGAEPLGSSRVSPPSPVKTVPALLYRIVLPAQENWF